MTRTTITTLGVFKSSILVNYISKQSLLLYLNILSENMQLCTQRLCVWYFNILLSHFSILSV